MIVQVEYDEDDIARFLEINELSEEYQSSQTLKKLLSVQNKIPILKGINPSDISAITTNLKFMKCKFKDYVVKEGDKTQEIFFIFSGGCHVFVGRTKVAEISSGQTFGEAAAVFNTTRNASVVCSTPEATLLSFCIDNDSIDLSAPALATLYKNLASQINTKLEQMNSNMLKK